MNSKTNQKNIRKLPDVLKQFLWSYNFSNLDAERDKKVIIVNTINYGDLKHWRWLVQRYGKPAVKEVLSNLPVSEFRPRVKKLVSIIFAIKDFNYAPRSTQHQEQRNCQH